MEDHNVVGVVEVFGQGLDVLAAQSVGHEDSSPVSVRPVDTILEEHKSQGRVSAAALFRGFIQRPILRGLFGACLALTIRG